MYNKQVLSEALANLQKRKAQLSKPKDIIVDPRGQYDHPGKLTRIYGEGNGTSITMQPDPKTGKPITYPVMAYPNVGQPQMMYPGNEYYFEGADSVVEKPMMQGGGPKDTIIYPPGDSEYMNQRPLNYDILEMLNQKARRDYENYMRDLKNPNSINKTSPQFQQKFYIKEGLGLQSAKYGGLTTGLRNTSGNLLMNKKGKRLMAQSGSLSATNELFLGNPLLTKRRRAVYVPGASFQEGGSIDAELTAEEIEQYRRGGYIVEEIPKAQEGLNNEQPEVQQELSEQQIYATPESRKKYEDVFAKAQSLVKTFPRAAEFFKQNKRYKDQGIEGISEYIKDITGYQKDAEKYYKARQAVKKGRMSTEDFERAYRERGWQQFDNKNVKTSEEDQKELEETWYGPTDEQGRRYWMSNPMNVAKVAQGVATAAVLGPGALASGVAAPIGYALSNPLVQAGLTGYGVYDATTNTLPEAYRDFSEGRYLEGMGNLGMAALDLAPIPLFGTNLLGEASQAGKFLSTQTPFKNAYKLNPNANKSAYSNLPTEGEIIKHPFRDEMVPIENLTNKVDYFHLKADPDNMPYSAAQGSEAWEQLSGDKRFFVKRTDTKPYAVVDNPVDYGDMTDLRKLPIPLTELSKYRLQENITPTPHWLKGYELANTPKQLPGSSVASSVDDVVDLYRVQERNAKTFQQLADEGKLNKAFNNPQTLARKAEEEKYFGQWFTNDKKDLDFYKADREFLDPEIVNLRVPKSELSKYSNYDKSLSRAPDREFVIPLAEQQRYLNASSVEDVGKNLEDIYKNRTFLTDESRGIKDIPWNTKTNKSVQDEFIAEHTEYMNSPAFAEKMKLEYPDVDIEQYKKAILHNLENKITATTKSFPDPALNNNVAGWYTPKESIPSGTMIMPGYKQGFRSRVNLANEEILKPAYQYREDAGKSFTKSVGSTVEHELGHQRTNSEWLLPDYLTKDFLTENLTKEGNMLASQEANSTFGFYNYHSNPTEFDTRLLNMKKDLKRQGVIDYTKSNDFTEEMLKRLDVSNTKPTDIAKELKDLNADFAAGKIEWKDYEKLKNFYLKSKGMVTTVADLSVTKDTKDLLKYWSPKFLAEQMKRLPVLVPAAIATGAALNSNAQENTQYQDGGIVLDLSDDEIRKYLEGGYIVEEYQDGGDVKSSHGWDYKKEGDKYFTKKVGTDKWIEPTGEALKAIQQKVFGDIEYTESDKKSDYISNVQNLISSGYTLDDLVKQRVGTKEGLIKLFPEFSKTKSTTTTKSKEVTEEPVEEVALQSLVTDNAPTRMPGIPNWQKHTSAINKGLKKPEYKEVEPTYDVVDNYGNQSQTESSALNYRDKVNLKPTELPYFPAWTDYTERINEGITKPEYTEAELTDEEIAELQAQGHIVEEVTEPEPWLNSLQNNVSQQSIYNTDNVTLDPFGRKPKYGPTEEQMSKLQEFMKTPEEKGLRSVSRVPTVSYNYGTMAGLSDASEGLANTFEKAEEVLAGIPTEGLSNVIEQIQQGSSDSESLGEVKVLKEEEPVKETEPVYNIQDLDPFKFVGERNGEIIQTYTIPLINESDTSVMYRNRGDKSDIMGKKLAYTYAPFKPYKETLNKKYGSLSVNDNTYVIALTADGIKGGKLKDFKDTDTPLSPTYVTENVTELVIEPNNKYFDGIGQKGLGLKTSKDDVKYIPVGTSDSQSGNFKNWSGGHLLVENPKTKVMVVLHGRSDQLKEMFNKYLETEGIESANIYETDHKAYSLITNPKDGIHRGTKNRQLDNYNTERSGAGNFIYLQEINE